MMSGTVQRAAETAVTKHYEALFRVSQTLVSIQEPRDSAGSRVPRENLENLLVIGVADRFDLINCKKSDHSNW